MLAALTLTAARVVVHGTGPEDLYLVEDEKLWLVFVAGSFLLSLALIVLRMSAGSAATSDGARSSYRADS